MVPVGAGGASGGALSLARALGVPTGAVAAARAVLDGAERRLDLLVDDSDGVVLGALRIPPLGGAGGTGGAGGVSGAGGAGSAEDSGTDAHHHHHLHWLRTCQSLVRTLAARPARVGPAPSAAGPTRLRVEVDGKTLVDLDQPLETLSVTPVGAGGCARVEARRASVGAEVAPLEATGRMITVAGSDFRYRADALVGGPVRTRTWMVREGAWGLILPA